jgi:hypothetical protein
MFKTQKRKNKDVTCEIIYPRHHHHPFHDLNGIYVPSPWPWRHANVLKGDDA